MAIQKSQIAGIYEMIPTYRSLLIQYNPIEIEVNNLIEKLMEIENNLDSIDLPKPRIIEIPTIYGGEFGEDLNFVAEHNGISADEVIKIHSSVDYLIYMLGFTPGFPYLGGMSDKIETPRLKTPRTKIPGGSVGIAGKQTGIYPIDSPGGWQLIGRTPVRLYDPKRSTPIILRAGDYLRFIPITRDEYDCIRNLEDKNQYEIKIITE
jgi:KipI family sensor histidine kinase inhibitor